MINILLVVWCISPLIFIPLYLYYFDKYNKEQRKNELLNKQIKDLLNQNDTSKQGSSSVSNSRDFARRDYPLPPKENNTPQTTYSQPRSTEKAEDKLIVIPPSKLRPTYYSQPAPTEQIYKKPASVSTINIVLIVGVIFIILAGIIFATTTWQDIPNYFRTIIIFSVTALFFVVSLFAEKKLKLEKTSIAFYFLGSIFLPICMISVGFFKLFGDWLTLIGDGRFVLYLLSSVLLGIAGFVGTQKYNMKSLAYTFYSCITISIIFFLKSLYLNNNIFVLCMAIISTIIIFAVSYISKKESEKYRLLLSCINSFAIINTIVLGIISVLVSDNTGIASLSTFIFAFIFLKNIFNPKEQGYGTFPFIILIIIGLYKLIIPESFSDFITLATATAVTSALVGFMVKSNENMTKLLHIFSVTAAVLCYLFLGVPLSLANRLTATTLIAETILLANTTWLGVKYKNKSALLFQPALLIVLMQGFVSYTTESTLLACVILSGLSLAAFIVYKKLDFLRTNFSDILFAFVPLFCMLTAKGTGFEHHEAYKIQGFSMLICSVIFVALVNLIVFEKNRTITDLVKFFEWVLPLSFSAIMLSIYTIAQKNGQLFFFIYFIIIISSAAFSAIFEKRKEIAKRFNDCLENYSYVLIFIAFLLTANNFNGKYIYPYFWLTAAFFGIKAFIISKENADIKKNIFSLISSFFIFAASIITTKNIINLIPDCTLSSIKSTLLACAILSGFSLFAFILHKKLDFLRTNFSDILFAFVPLFCMLTAQGTGFEHHEAYKIQGFSMLICSVIFVALVSLIVFEKNRIRTDLVKFFEWVLPLSISTIMLSIYTIAQKNGQLFFFIYFIIIITAASLSVIFEKRKDLAKRFNGCLESYSYTLIFIAFLLTANSFNSKYIYPYLWLTAAFFGIKSYISHKNENAQHRNIFFYLTSCFVLAASLVSTANFTDEKTLFVLVPTIVTLSAAAFYILYKNIFKKEMLLSFQLESFIAFATAFEALLLILKISVEDLSMVYSIFCALCISTSYFMFLMRKNNIFAFLPTLIIFPLIHLSVNQLELDNTSSVMTLFSVVIFVLLAFLARAIHKKAVTINEDGKTIIDWLSIMNILAILNIQSQEYSEFITLVLLSVYPLIFFNRLAHKSANLNILTTSCVLGVLTFWAQPFVEIVAVIEAEVNIIPVILFCIAFSHIWKNNKKMADSVCFYIAVIAIVFLSFDAIICELLTDALILAGAMLTMVIVSYMKKRKRWFILSVGVLVFLTIYLSRSFWLSLEWWIYLLSTGIILIVIASMNEVQKQKGSSLKKEASRLMSEWKW